MVKIYQDTINNLPEKETTSEEVNCLKKPIHKNNPRTSSLHGNNDTRLYEEEHKLK